MPLFATYIDDEGHQHEAKQSPFRFRAFPGQAFLMANLYPVSYLELDFEKPFHNIFVLIFSVCNFLKILHSGLSQNFCLFKWRGSGWYKSWQFLHLRRRIIFFIALAPPQIYDRPIRMGAGYYLKIWGGVCGIRRGKTRYIKNSLHE